MYFLLDLIFSKCQFVCFFQSVIHKAGFRSLDDGEECEFESKPSGMGVEATFVAGPGGIECKGSSRRPLSRKKFKKIRSDLVPDNLVYF